MKPAHFLKRSRDKDHSWNRWSQQWNNAWKGLSPSKYIQEFTEQEALAKQQVEAARAKLEAFEAMFPRSE
jgi:hypothetical protein